MSKLLRDAAFTRRPTELSCRLKKNDLSQEILLSKQFMYWKSITLMNEFLEEKIHASVAKLGNRCFCWFPSAMLELIQVNTSKASLYYLNLYKFG